MTVWPHGRDSLDDFIRPMSSLWPVQKCQLSKMLVSCVSDPTAFPPSVRKRGEMWRTNLPLFLPEGSRLIQTRCWMFNSLLFSFAAQTQMKRWRVAGADLLRVFIRYYNLRFLRGQGQRWLLFAPYFMAGEDNRPTPSPSGSHGGPV